MILTAEKVTDLFMASLSENGTIVEGITARFGMDVTGREAAIGELLDQLPDEFKATLGGGWSFLNACTDRDGNQWTGMHLVMEQLFVLGIAAEKARWLMPREMWSVFPGGMPYVVIN